MSALEIFKAGTHTDMNGQRLEFTEEDLKASVAAYDPALFAAPLVVGHPKLNDPAYGWLKSVDTDGNLITAEPEHVDAEFAEMVNKKRFPRISTSFFHPQSPSNPKPGVWYIRHVGFLGAKAPAVKGLKAASFADTDASEIVTVEFAAPGTSGAWAITRMFRGLREFLIEDRNTEVADKVIPDWLITSYEEETREAEERIERPLAEYSDSIEEDETMDPKKTADFAERETTLQAREAQIAEREQRLQEQEAKQRADEIASFADQVIDAGKVLPRDRDGLVAFMDGLNDAEVVEFADGDQTIKKPSATWFREFLDRLPEQVSFSEHSAQEDTDEEHSASFAAPSGYTVDQERLALHNKAQAYARKNDCDYNTALAAVS
ncbi:hypothetical protein [Marinobacterium litorale]|uniref:hypothetical protein n=1 Tax=Marinobacterium litorale TaxID=404770 RepID=UPI000404975F|nr:hypothetical protein [Marinobacterium litorale]